MEFDPEAVQMYFTIHNEFTKLLAVLIELGSGLPARGTELVQLQHTNTLLGPCNIFVHDGSVFMALPSNKGTGRQKIIPRFLPHAVGCLVVHYVSQVVPFVHLLYNSVIEPRKASAMLLVDHAGRLWDTNTVSKTLQSLCKQYNSSASGGLTMRTWHQLAVSIDRKLIRPKKVMAEELEDHTHDLQAGHSTSTAEQHYGLDASMLMQLNQESMTAMLEVSEQWHAFWKMRTRFQEAVPALVPLSSGHACTESTKAIHAVKQQLDVVQEEMRSIKQKLDHPISACAPAIVSASAAPSRSAAISGKVREALVKVTGSQCAKMVEQAYALNAIHSKESPLIIVMATGSGKSALFMSPLHWLQPASVVIVVVPFIALTEDLLQQCGHVGITASKWDGYRCASKVEGSQLVFVAAENCYSEAFGNWAQDMVHQERLAAIFFDECHVCITQSSFRHAMDKIKWLISMVHVPQYFLTTTLPPSMLASFKSQLLLPQDGTGLIHAATNHKNIAYVVMQVASQQEKMHQLQRLLTKHASGPVMVFCKYKDEVQPLAEQLGCSFIHADVDGKLATLSTWLQCSAAETNNSKCILVGTSAIGTGINPQHVQLVVHYGDAWDIVSYAQESGCAGRSGTPATAVLLALEHMQHKECVQEYVEEKTCRCLMLSTYLDGMPVMCLSQPDFVLCDLCKVHIEEPTTPPRKMIGLASPPLSEKRDHCTRSAHMGSAGTSSQAMFSCGSRGQSSTDAITISSSPTQQHKPQEQLPTISLQLSPNSFYDVPPTPPMMDKSSIKGLLDSFDRVCPLCYLFC